ncbi:MAG: hypothetical protein Q4E33_00140 [Erysipelotrichaceae bacterium]|nr:hypothetical protein [Erysipelotrichaceae bacterium]
MPKVILRNLNDDYYEENIVTDTMNNNCLFYTDRDKNNVEVCIFDDGICLFKEAKDYMLELHLRNKTYAKITSSEGIVEIDVKMVEFSKNNVNILVHYLIDGEDKVIEIKN